MGRPKKEAPNRKNGLYEVKVTVGTDALTGKPIRMSFYSSVSKAVAKAKAEDYKIAQATGEQAVKRETFETWALKVLDSLKGTVKDSTYQLTYENSIKNHLIPYFKKSHIQDIKQIDLQNYFNKQSKVYTLETLKKHKMALNKIFTSAMLNDIIINNPCQALKLTSSVKPAEKNVYNEGQVKKILEYTKIHRFGLEVHLMLCYGISRSELLGLRVCDIDFDNLIMSINHGLVDIDGKLVLGEPKNDFRKREIPIAQETADMLRQCTHEYVICTKSGKPCHPRTWQRRHYEVFMQDMMSYYDNTIPRLSPHELRHTRASLWVNAGENLFAIASILGHADLKMLRKRYAHGDIEAIRKLVTH